ncbi:MAG TPA: endonuclease/exonuclease/phosphatase family protein [Casimicrobiaceae bacterium]|nr:endonuclease/exonuclease/phosphatase family protein [Casimicrobiaceae bacterium]
MAMCGGRALGRCFHVRSFVPCVCAALLVAGCISITAKPRALLVRDDGSVAAQTLACSSSIDAKASTRPRQGAALDPRGIRIASWNIHKQADAGWRRDLISLADRSDLMLLQESVLDPPLRGAVDTGGFRFMMASSFFLSNTDVGVVTASRVAPLAFCTARFNEPLLRIPKSALVAWFPLAGRGETLAVANVHAINFTLSLRTFRAELGAIGDTLAHHRGPIIVAGDLNTWSDARVRVVRALAARLGLDEVRFPVDRRSRFFGHTLDHIYTRDLETLASSTRVVASSDHNPVAATLAVIDQRPRDVGRSF